jgi:uncharacterized membrane protein HdeD (DUF308 family)
MSAAVEESTNSERPALGFFEVGAGPGTKINRSRLEAFMSTAVTTIVRKKTLGWSIALSVLMILAGTVAIFLPLAAGIVATIYFGWLIVFSGGAHLIYGWHTRSRGGLLLELLLGVVYIVAGIYLLLNPVAGLASLTLALGMYLFVESVFEFILSYRLRQRSGWGWLLSDAIITLIVAVLVWRTWPWNAPWVIGTLVGVSMLFSGVSRLAISAAARRVEDNLA